MQMAARAAMLFRGLAWFLDCVQLIGDWTNKP